MSEELERVYQAILEMMQAGQPGAVVTVISAGESGPRGAGVKMLLRADGSTVGTVGGGAAEAWAVEQACAAIVDGRCREVVYRPESAEAGGDCGAGMRVFVEPLPLRPTLLIVGAGHVGQAVAELGEMLGYRVVVMDERAELVTAERFPRAQARLSGDPAQRVAEFPLDERSCVVIVTPHGAPDERVLAALAGRPLAYVGMMGSRQRAQATLERARQAGVPEGLLARVHAPVGLDIGARTPREIAVSILAQIVAVQRGKA